MAEGFAVDENDTVEQWVDYHREQIEQSRAVAASMDLDTRCPRTDLIERNVRYVLFSMIGETARHAGHADSSARLSMAPSESEAAGTYRWPVSLADAAERLWRRRQPGRCRAGLAAEIQKEGTEVQAFHASVPRRCAA